MGAIVGVVVGILGGALVTGVCVTAGHFVLRWVSSRHPSSQCTPYRASTILVSSQTWCT